MSNTIFSKILEGKAEASFIYRDELVAAFLDIHPINPGHALVVPQRSVASLAELDDETAARMFNVARRIAAAIRASSINCDGINLILADGETAGQEVLHIHLHVVPRVSGDGFGFKHSQHSFKLAERNVLNDVAQEIRSRVFCFKE